MFIECKIRQVDKQTYEPIGDFQIITLNLNCVQFSTQLKNKNVLIGFDNALTELDILYQDFKILLKKHNLLIQELSEEKENTDRFTAIMEE